MCRTSLISSNIVRLSTRSYKQRLEVVAPDGFHVSRLARLNKDLDDFYELLYDQWQTVTEEDYKLFGRQLDIMLQTLKALLTACKHLPESTELHRELEKLNRNYAALHELNSDIVHFKIKLPKDMEMKALMNRAAKVSKQIVA